MRVSVDAGRCAASGTCAQLCPEVFELRGDGSLLVLDAEPPEHLHAQVREAVEMCPTEAITFSPTTPAK